MVRLDVDDRERGSRVYELLVEDPGFDLRTSRLRVRDYVVEQRVVVERKTFGDFAASVIDTRLFNQARELRRTTGCGVLILEGRPGSCGPRLGRAQLQGALITLTLVFGIPLLRSSSPHETIWLLRALSRHATRAIGKGLASRRWNPRDRDAARIHMLTSLPSVGPERATRLLARFGSLQAVCDASEEQLADVRGVGSSTARRIREFLEKS